ncbi:unnamed protein product [Bemisia tabaci]|uniref:Membrane magnesium transporter n=1 Tax=Bemisia tabaci TaxID=7038 RepID=A0A9P0F4T6_BEMTA|nr:unnamed protein product [Bemisia tabaci]
MFPRTFLTMGILSLFHAAYSAVQHRSYLRITAQEFTTLPLDILLQAIISMFLTMYGILQIAGDFKEIRATVDLESKSWETLRNIPSFYTVNHRGRALSPEFDPASLKSQTQSLSTVSSDAVYS